MEQVAAKDGENTVRSDEGYLTGSTGRCVHAFLLFINREQNNYDKKPLPSVVL